MVGKFWLHRTGTQLSDSLVRGAPNDYARNVSQQLQSDLSVTGTTDPTQHRLPLPRLDIFAVDAGEAPPDEWEAEDDVTGGPLDPREVKIAREEGMQYLWDTEVCEYSTEAEARAQDATQLASSGSIPTKAAPKLHVIAFGVYGGAPQKVETDLLGNGSAGNSMSPTLCCVPDRRFSV